MTDVKIVKMYTPETVREILTETIEAIASPENRSRLSLAREAAGNEMLKMMQTVFPMIVQIESEVIKRRGLAAGREGMVHFTQAVREMERIDPEIALLHSQIRTNFLPPVSIASTFDIN